jgi:putative N6-adenine-specific DNA methylase
MIQAVAVLPPGLEACGADELAALGADAIEARPRAVACRCDMATLYRLHLQARLPFRILRELARLPCRGPEDLHHGIADAIDWDRWLPPQRSLRVDVSGRAPGLMHSHITAVQVKNALVGRQLQRWGDRSRVDRHQPDLAIHIHLARGEAVLSLDGSGGSLHRRGYRPAVGDAPLKENLAAGLIALSGWDGSCPLVDPLCGSGTLLLEAACRHWRRAPGLQRPDGPRSWPLQHWADFDADLWRRERQAASGAALPVSPAGPPLLGLERDPAILEQARGNAARAGVAAALSLQQGDFRSLEPPDGPGVLVCNPPYGLRLGDEDALEALYGDLGSMVRERCSGWTLWLLSGNPRLTRALRLRASRRIPVSNGGINCRWLRYEIR